MTHCVDADDCDDADESDDADDCHTELMPMTMMMPMNQMMPMTVLMPMSRMIPMNRSHRHHRTSLRAVETRPVNAFIVISMFSIRIFVLGYVYLQLLHGRF